MVISTAHRSRYCARTVSRLNVRSVVKTPLPRARACAGRAFCLGAVTDDAPLPPGAAAPAARYATARSTPGRAPRFRWDGVASPTVCGPRFSEALVRPPSSADTLGAVLSGG